jgi:periplasmic mercuric ion binding protein
MKYLSAAALALALSTGVALAAEQQAKIQVSGLTCPSCPYIAAQAVESVESVKILDGEYFEQEQYALYTVSYDDAITSPEEIAAAPEDYGYPGKVLDPASGS